jgi:hypothetical protein
VTHTSYGHVTEKLSPSAILLTLPSEPQDSSHSLSQNFLSLQLFSNLLNLFPLPFQHGAQHIYGTSYGHVTRSLAEVGGSGEPKGTVSLRAMEYADNRPTGVKSMDDSKVPGYLVSIADLID